MKLNLISSSSKRIFGLDLLRFLAIFFVLLGHSAILVPAEFKNGLRTLILDGVSIFFVLSGFLIGRILLKQIAEGKTSFSHLLTFWKRRWLRTVPAYFFILIFLLLYTYLLKPSRIPDDWYKYFLFTQNMFQFQAPFFQESWSLSIEEWFYLLVPVILFLSVKLLKKINRNTLILSILILSVIAIFCLRLYLFHHTEIFTKIEKSDILLQIFPRLDSIMFGVIAAFFSLNYHKIWNHYNHWKWFAAMFLALFLIKFLNSGNESIYYIVVSPTLKSFAVLLMLPFLSQWKLQSNNSIARFITFISLTSYSIYLINRTIVIDIIIKYALHGDLKTKYEASSFWGIEYVLFWTLTPILAYFLYRFIERPFMKLRKE